MIALSTSIIKINTINKLSAFTPPQNTHFIRHFLNTKSKRSTHTSAAYERDIKNFFKVNFIEDISLFDIKKVTIFDVENYIIDLIDQGRKSSTISRKITSLSSLYSWLMKYQDNNSDTALLKYNPFSNMKDIKPTLTCAETEFLTRDEAAAFLKSMNTDTIVGLRNKCIVSLALNTAIRKSEIINIKIKDITSILGYDVIRVTRKRGKEDYVKINSFVKNLIFQYLNETKRNIKDNCEDYLFKGHSTNKLNKSKLDATSINKMLNSYIEKFDINKKIKVHSLRHSAITMAIQKGATIEKVQAFACHASASTTSRYIHSINKLQDNAGDLIDVFE